MSGFRTFSWCSQGAKKSSNFTSPIPTKEVNPQNNAQTTSVKETKLNWNFWSISTREGQTRNTPNASDLLEIRKVTKSIVAIATAQEMQIASATKSTFMPAKIAIYPAIADAEIITV